MESENILLILLIEVLRIHISYIVNKSLKYDTHDKVHSPSGRRRQHINDI